MNEISNDAQVVHSIRYLDSEPVTKRHFKLTNRGVVEKRHNPDKCCKTEGDVVLLTPVGVSTTGTVQYKIGICDAETAWAAQLRNSNFVVFTSKNIDEIIAKYHIPVKSKFNNQINAEKEATEDEAVLVKLEFLQALVENDICIPKHNFNHGENQQRAPHSDGSTSSGDAAVADVLPGRPATI